MCLTWYHDHLFLFEELTQAPGILNIQQLDPQEHARLRHVYLGQTS